MFGNQQHGFSKPPLAKPAPSSKGASDDMYGGFESVDINSLRTATGKPQSSNITVNLNNNAGGPGNFAGTIRKQPLGSVMMGRGGADVGARPMTAIRGAGYSSDAKTMEGTENQKPKVIPALVKKTNDTPEDLAREMERIVNRLIEESAVANLKGDKKVALDKAKESAAKERALTRHREANNMSDQINIDLTYSVNFNLANQQHANGLYTEALKTYQLIVKNKQYAQAGRLRVNMGNIYYEQHQYTWAIRMYRMALDQIPTTGKDMRYKIQRNIGHAFVRMGQYPDAIQSYEAIIEGGIPDIQTGFNLLVCYYMLNEKEKMKKIYGELLTIKPDHLNQAVLSSQYGLSGPAGGGGGGGGGGFRGGGGGGGLASSVTLREEDMLLLNPNDHDLMLSQNRKDDLKETLKMLENKSKHYILMASKLIAPVIERDLITGYNFIIQLLNGSMYYEKIGADMEISLSVLFMKERKFDLAIERLKSFEKKDHEMMAQAATNLSFVYFVQKDYHSAEKYANIAVDNDRYNARALVNKGNCYFAKSDFNHARENYAESVAVEADCVEGIYNLGLVFKMQKMYDLAIEQFKKLQTILPDMPEVLFQLSDLYFLIGEKRECIKWRGHLKARVATDPNNLRQIALMYNEDDDETSAYHHFLDSYKYMPTSIEVISWLGGYCVKQELYEKALEYFTRASFIQPKVVNWKLMVGSCLRRIGRFQEAFRYYEEIHEKFPDNVETLKYLIQLCKNINLGFQDKLDEYSNKLIKLERLLKSNANEIKDNNTTVAASATSVGSRDIKMGSGAASAQAQPQEPSGPHIEDEELNKYREKKKKVKMGEKDDDDWGDGRLDELLPGT